MNTETGEVRRWDSLTAEQQQSGQWIKLPPIGHDDVPRARLKMPFDDMPMRSMEDELRATSKLIREATQRGTFDAMGKPR